HSCHLSLEYTRSQKDPQIVHRVLLVLVQPHPEQEMESPQNWGSPKPKAIRLRNQSLQQTISFLKSKLVEIMLFTLPLLIVHNLLLSPPTPPPGGAIYKHHQQPLITNGKHNILSPLKDIGGSRSPFLIKIHGALMFIGWITTVSIGVIVARFFKPVWPNTLLFGEEIWFQIHRSLMIITILLTSISFVLPFIYRGGWNKQAGFHPYFGSTVMALALLQSLMAAFRPPPQAPRRQIFNWLHWSAGTTARILAVVTIFLGMDLPALNLPPWDTYVMIGFVAWHVGIDVLLELHGYCLIRKVEVLEDDRVQILQSISSAEAQGHTFKKAMLFIYICGNIAFLVTFITAVVQV
uniref:Ferric chelate reductase 1 n=1 Tax=Laticauda laticaudata TaxID=8630 RepID=A0A8C5RXM2_LATLA